MAGQTKTKKRKRGKASLTVPLNAAGRALLGGASNATLKLTVKAGAETHPERSCALSAPRR